MAAIESNARLPRSPRKSPASREIMSTHLHDCPQCGESYPGYAPKCKEARELMCGPCLAEEFFSHREFEVMQKSVSIL